MFDHVAIFAGGNGSRLGGINKALMPVAGKMAYQHVLDQLGSAANIIINTQRDVEAFAGLTIVADQVAEGPFSGLLALLRHVPPGNTLLTAPCDAVQLPHRYRHDLHIALQHYGIVCASHDGQIEPLCLGILVSNTLKLSAENYYASGGRSVRRWLLQQSAHQVDFPEPAIWSVNTPAELAQATQRLEQC